MALQNPNTGEYLKVIDTNRSNTEYIIFADKAQRERYESGISQYENYRRGSNNSALVGVELDKLADSSNSVFDNMLTAAYNAIKADTFDFSTWESV